MKVVIARLGKRIFKGEAEKVVLPARDGEMCLLQNHESIITTLRKGIIKVFKPSSEYPVIVELGGGICSFSDNKATVIILE